MRVSPEDFLEEVVQGLLVRWLGVQELLGPHWIMGPGGTLRNVICHCHFMDRYVRESAAWPV